jgi:CBS domain-containing protein
VGDHSVDEGSDEERRHRFTKALLDDLEALQAILDGGHIESGIRRIGAEQEMFLVDGDCDPAPMSPEILDLLQDDRFTTELGRYNLEANLPPLPFGGDFLRVLEAHLSEINTVARAAAAKMGGDVLLVGILPTLQRAHLALEYMTPNPRYYELNRVMTELAGGRFKTHIEGTDEIHLEHDNVLLEAANTSYQLHWQVDADEFEQAYNIAQLITAPLMAVSVNSPCLLGKRLWHETRIALFEQSVDVRHAASAARGQTRRVGFGDHWVNEGPLELFRENIAHHRVVLSQDTGEMSTARLARGDMPDLKAMCLHNGTVYRWNRPCFGVVDGVPHLRIENRVIPAGPTIIDEVLNAALFFGLMAGMPKYVPDPRERIPFDACRANFLAAARQGLYAGFHWLDSRDVAADVLLKEELIPIAREGLLDAGTDPADVDRTMGLLEERVATRRTGALWILQSLDKVPGDNDLDRHRNVTSQLAEHQARGLPIHRWTLAEPGRENDWRAGFRRVDQVMATKLFTVGPDDVVDLAASLMDWKHIRHIPVEENGRLVGLLSSRALLRLVAKGGTEKIVAVRDVMATNVITIGPDESPLRAIELMKENSLGVLPVVEDEKLIGIVSERDFLTIAGRVLKEAMGEV